MTTNPASDAARAEHEKKQAFRRFNAKVLEPGSMIFMLLGIVFLCQPWVEFLHGGVPCRGTLRLVEFGAGGRAGDIQVSCDQCGRRRRLIRRCGDVDWAQPTSLAQHRGRPPA